MKSFKKVLALVLICVIASGIFAGCGKEEKQDLGEKLKVSVTVTTSEANLKDDKLYKFISDKFGLEFDIKPIPTEGMAEKTRLMVASGTLSDLTFGEFMYKDYLSWGKQGLIKPLPEDYKEKYPNIHRALQRTKMLEKLEEEGNGFMYGIPRAMTSNDQYGIDIDAPNIDRHCFAYRKDWAEKLGIEVSPIMKYDDFIDMAVAFKKADFGNVGQANNMGIAVSSSNAPFIFIHAQNPNWNIFYKNSKGKYVCGYNDKATLEGVKAYREAYEKGVLHKSFYTHKTSDIQGYFHSQKTGLLFQTFGGGEIQKFKTDFESANPGLDADECIGLTWIEGKDGKVRGRETTNYWSCLYFNPDIDEEVYTRLLTMIDFFASEEGAMLLGSGFEGEDYKIEDGKFVSLIPVDENKTPKPLKDVYPSIELFSLFNPSSRIAKTIEQKNIDLVRDMIQAKLDSDLETKKINLDVEFYTSDKYGKFMSTHDIATMATEIITKGGNIEKSWKEKISSIQHKIDEVCSEMNKTLK